MKYVIELLGRIDAVAGHQRASGDVGEPARTVADLTRQIREYLADFDTRRLSDDEFNDAVAEVVAEFEGDDGESDLGDHSAREELPEGFSNDIARNTFDPRETRESIYADAEQTSIDNDGE